MLVASIIILAVAIAVPSLQGMAHSNRFAQTVNTLSGLVTTAQSAAKPNGVDVGIRIEPAFKIDNDTGLMIKNDRTSLWLDHQQARIVKSKYDYFYHEPGSRVYALPADVWLAPGYCLGWGAAGLAQSSLESSTYLSPADGNAAYYSRLDTFYIVFDGNGELTIRPASENKYEDRTQRWYNTTDKKYVDPVVDHLDDSARSVLVYDRRKWLSINTMDGATRYAFLDREARAVHFNRATGGVVEAAP